MEQIKQPVPKEHHIREECGVFGVFSRATSDVASLAYYGLFALQHRGQESAGIAVNDDGVFTAYCDEGLVNEVFPKERIKQLGTGNIVVGHVRYATRTPRSVRSGNRWDKAGSSWRSAEAWTALCARRFWPRRSETSSPVSLWITA